MLLETNFWPFSQVLRIWCRVSVFDGDNASVCVHRLWEGTARGAGLCGLQPRPEHLSPGTAEESRCAGCESATQSFLILIQNVVWEQSSTHL